MPTPLRIALGALTIPLLLGAVRPAVADDPIIRRTEYGVVHIDAATFRGAGIGLGYTQAEDYGVRVILSLVRADRKSVV